ncbi:MAG: hypothetical protein H0X62_15870 [Bacteroidetes bacterium]|nr:hypothetical protein [Bacteroidota bacterium]
MRTLLVLLVFLLVFCQNSSQNSDQVYERLDLLDIKNQFYPFKGAGHTPYAFQHQTAAAFRDTAILFIGDFLSGLD